MTTKTKTTAAMAVVRESAIQGQGFRLKAAEAYLEAIQAIRKAGIQRSDVFGPDVLSLMKGWPEGKSLAQAKKAQPADKLVLAINAFSFFFYSYTEADEDGNINILSDEEMKEKKSEKKEKSGKGKKVISAKKEELSIPTLLEELEAAFEREKDDETRAEGIEALDLLLATLKIQGKAKKTGGTMGTKLVKTKK